MSAYIPERGDVVWLSLDPQAGHEQSGRRPALVLSPMEYNMKTGLAIFVLVTTKEKGYPFEVVIPTDLKLSGVVLSDQVKSLDWKFRRAKLICKLSDDTLQEVIEKLRVLL